MKKLLIIDEGHDFRRYLSRKLKAQGFSVLHSANAFDGSLKMRKELPGLVIMDNAIAKKTLDNFLSQKIKDKNTAPIPIILLSERIDSALMSETAKYNIQNIITKPIKIDLLLKSVCDFFGAPFQIDETPCSIEANSSGNVIFVEAARGLNSDKIEILRLKLDEFIKKRSAACQKALLMMSGIELDPAGAPKIENLLAILLKTVNGVLKNMAVLTTSKSVKAILKTSPNFSRLAVKDNLTDALDYLIGQKNDSFAQDRILENNLLTLNLTNSGKISLRFESENVIRELETLGSEVSLALIDSDPQTLPIVEAAFKPFAWHLDAYQTASAFTAAIASGKTYSLVFLSLTAPHLTAPAFTAALKNAPLIAFSSLPVHEAAQKASGYGISAYMSKPLQIALLRRKAASLLASAS